MDWHRRARRAYEMDLAAIDILADIARYAPNHVACQMMRMIVDRAIDAMHWLIILCMQMGNHMPPYGAPYLAENKNEK